MGEKSTTTISSIEVGLEVIAGVLTWAPGLVGTVGNEIDAISLCAREDGTGTEYGVTHYRLQDCGRAFGPLNLEQTLRFCQALHHRLESRSSISSQAPNLSRRTRTSSEAPVWLTTEPGNQDARMNAAVLLGAYLILRKDWTAQRVFQVLGAQESERRFPCSWARTRSSHQKDVMTVRHCWQGLEAAKRNGWVNLACMEDDVCTSFACGQYSRWLSTYDAAWIVPGRILVCADPVTTALDPNPCTFTKLWPEDEDEDELDAEPISPSTPIPDWESPMQKPATPPKRYELMRVESFSPKKTDEVVSRFPSVLPRSREDVISSSDFKQIKPEPPLLQPGYNPSPASDWIPAERVVQRPSFRSSSKKQGNKTSRTTQSPASNADSIISVCKDYKAGSTERNCSSEDLSGEAAVPFFRFLREQSISAIVRANFDYEPGMQVRSYGISDVQALGFEHVDCPVADVRGGLHPAEDIAKVLKVCVPHLERGTGVAVHCKSGFGRSVVLACCLAMECYHVSGEDLLGWVRIARPGAINTMSQEQFLCSFKDRASLRKYAQAGKGCCTLQ
eukprot:TRINITY_DN4077_c0_g1_i1.p1 TRINITY_DN4077_c0_g1~~TRINITY_DN4077_c0_g1_i1.p1  ORF type:complete len:561 (-),score=59.19 TRINITY_DN4077_c0_g1_i1:56-1738(-)